MSEDLRRCISLEVIMAKGTLTEKNVDFALRTTMEATDLLLEALPDDVFLASRNLENIRRMVINASRERIKEFVLCGDEVPLGINIEDLKCVYDIGRIAI